MKRFAVIMTVLTVLITLTLSASAAMLPFPDLMGKELEIDRDMNEVRDRLHEGEEEEYDYFDDYYTLEVTKDFYFRTFIRPGIALLCCGVALFALYAAVNEVKNKKRDGKADE